MSTEKYIHFDWAVKRMLRDKANFVVLEGLLTVLLDEKITITEILESESNQDSYDDKFNRVDIKARNSKDEIIIVEVQLSREVYFLERILYGVSKTICEHMSLGSDYDKVKKVYSVNILYFDMGTGSDYLYHGKTEFKGVFTEDILQIRAHRHTVLEAREIGQVADDAVLIVRGTGEGETDGDGRGVQPGLHPVETFHQHIQAAPHVVGDRVHPDRFHDFLAAADGGEHEVRAAGVQGQDCSFVVLVHKLMR